MKSGKIVQDQRDERGGRVQCGMVAISLVALIWACTGCTSYKKLVDADGVVSYAYKTHLLGEDDKPDVNAAVAATKDAVEVMVMAELDPYYILSYDRTAQAKSWMSTAAFAVVDTLSVPYRVGAGVVGSVRDDPLARGEQEWPEIVAGVLTTAGAGYGAYYLVDKNKGGDADPPPPPPEPESDVSFTINALNELGFTGNQVQSIISARKTNESGSGQAFLGVNLTAEQIAALAALGLFQ